MYPKWISNARAARSVLRLPAAPSSPTHTPPPSPTLPPPPENFEYSEYSKYSEPENLGILGIPHPIAYHGLATLPNSMPGGVFQCDKCYPDCPPPICEGILKEFQVSPQKSGNSRDFRTFPLKFSGFSEISQITIFGLKPCPRGSGAWKQPQQSISKAGLHRIPWLLWAGSPVLGAVALSRCRIGLL